MLISYGVKPEESNKLRFPTEEALSETSRFFTSLERMTKAKGSGDDISVPSVYSVAKIKKTMLPL